MGPAGQHTEAAVDYEQSPPAGGEHNPVWQNEGFYEKPVRNETAVHTLEHGAVWITYQPDLPQEHTIRELVEAQTRVLASPYEGLDAPVVASAWGKQLRLETDDSDLQSFIQSYRQGPQTPEPARPAPAGLRSRYDEGERFLGLQRRAARWIVRETGTSSTRCCSSSPFSWRLRPCTCW